VIRVRIPATTANLGPGFDCMGLALDLWNSFELHLTGSEYRVINYGEGAHMLANDASNLTITTLCSELDRMGISRPEGVEIVCHNTVPCASGLGSSSTATLAGVVFAHAIAQASVGNDPADLDRAAILERAVEIEGHGDNVAPALLGGFVIVMPDSGGVLTQSIPYVPIKTVVCVPDFAFLTSVARAVLPSQYAKADAIFNIGRAILVTEALRLGDDAMLARAMNDRIHEPYRLGHIPGATEAKAAATEAGAICVALSGAGPGIVAFARAGYDRIGRAMNAAFAQAGLSSRYWILDPTAQGTHIGRLPV